MLGWRILDLTEPTVDDRPLLVIGKGAAYAQADGVLRSFVEATGLPFLGTAMGRGVVPDSHAACVQSARSLALSQADVAIVVGARCASCARSGGVKDAASYASAQLGLGTILVSCQGMYPAYRLGSLCSGEVQHLVESGGGRQLQGS